MNTHIEITDDLRIAIVEGPRRDEVQLDRESALRIGLALIGLAGEPPLVSTSDVEAGVLA